MKRYVNPAHRALIHLRIVMDNDYYFEFEKFIKD